MTRLGKAQAEALLADYDVAPIEALTTALRITFDAPLLEWAALLDLADVGGQRREALHQAEQAALDDLAAELNEARHVPRLTP